MPFNSMQTASSSSAAFPHHSNAQYTQHGPFANAFLPIGVRHNIPVDPQTNHTAKGNKKMSMLWYVTESVIFA